MIREILSAALLLGVARALTVDVMTDSVTVEEGESLELECASEDVWNVCEWTREQDR